MATALTATEERAPYRRHPLSLEDFHKLGDAGVLDASARVELFAGELIDMAPIGSRHAGIVAHLSALLGRQAPQALLWVQNPLSLPPDSELLPDLMLLQPRTDYYKGAAPTAPDVLLLIEVADTTLAYDRDYKLPLYARHGVPEVWLVDVAGACLEVHERPEAGGYRLRTLLHAGDRAVPGQVAGVAVEVAALF